MSDFDDLLDANRAYAEDFSLSGFDGIAHAGIAMVTCMDSRIEPLEMIGLKAGDAKILRNPGGRVTDQALVALVLGVVTAAAPRPEVGRGAPALHRGGALVAVLLDDRKLRQRLVARRRRGAAVARIDVGRVLLPLAVVAAGRP